MKRRMLACCLLLAAVGIGTVASQHVAVPNEFAAGTAISASQMNANFEVLVAAVNDLCRNLAAAETTIDRQAATIADLETHLERLVGRVAAAEREVRRLEDELGIAGLERRAVLLEEGFAEFDARVGALERLAGDVLPADVGRETAAGD